MRVALGASTFTVPHSRIFKDEVDMQLPNGDRAIVPIEKLRDYCLNPSHRVGGHKAHVFESVLGLTVAHAEALRQRLLMAARTEEAVLGVHNAYGQRYVVDFGMTTPVGTAVVRSTWIVLVREEVPRLTSCSVV
jgi:hypothetical protein